MKITKRIVDTAELPVTGQTFIRDSELRGFALRITHKGAKSFVVERKINGRNRRITIGPYPTITVEQAKDKAREILAGMILNKTDPIQAKEDRALALKPLQAVIEDYFQDRRLKPTTVRMYRAAIRLVFTDWLELPIRDITRDMVTTKFHVISANSPSRANHHFRLLNAIFMFAMGRYYRRDGKPLIESNPVQVLTVSKSWNRINRRKSYIKPHELPAWWRAIQGLPGLVPNPNDVIAHDFMIFLLLTGLRRREASQLEWANVDMEARLLTVIDTKNHDPHTLPLSDYLHGLLGRINTGGRYVFPSPRSASGHLENVDYQVKRVRAASGVDFMLHDLRRTFATVAESLDLSAYTLRRLLNHRQSDVTSGYIVSDIERLREPMQRITDKILKMAQEI